MPIRRQKNGRWLVEFQQAGIRVFRHLPAGRGKADAQALETKLRGDIFKARSLGVTDEPLLSAAIEAWLTRKAIRHSDGGAKARERSTVWGTLAEGRLLREAPEVAARAIEEWEKVGEIGGATINRRLAILKATCRWAFKQGVVEVNYSPRIDAVEESPAPELYLTRAQVKALAKAAPSREAGSAFILLAYTGLRAKELLALGKVRKSTASLLITKQVDRDRTKSGKARVVPIAKAARPHLAVLPLAMTYDQLFDAFEVARQKVGIEPRPTLHTLRHTCASWLIQARVDLYTVGRLLGHSSQLTTARYAHLADATLKRAVARL